MAEHSIMGRRKIPKKYREALYDLLGLYGVSRTFISRLLSTADRGTNKEELIDEIHILRKALNIKVVEESLTVSTLAFKVFCSLGFLRPSDTSDHVPFSDIKVSFPKQSDESLRTALDELSVLGAVERSGDHYTILEPTVYIKMLESQNDESKISIMKQLLAESVDTIDDWWNNRNALVTTTVISVKKEEYQKCLEEFRTSVIRFQAQVESGQADQLIAVNILVHPIES